MTTLNLECRSCLCEESPGLLDSMRPRISHQDVSDHHAIVFRGPVHLLEPALCCGHWELYGGERHL